MVLVAVACVAQTQSTGPGAVQPQAASGCDGACTHYLQCKGVMDVYAQQNCVNECYARQYDEQTLAQFQQTDCASAIQFVDGGDGGGGQGGAAQSADCQGCVRDGDSCIWLSQSNWGAGPYSGAASSCSPSCCGM